MLKGGDGEAEGMRSTVFVDEMMLMMLRINFDGFRSLYFFLLLLEFRVSAGFILRGVSNKRFASCFSRMT